jgi:hypothetical protein
MLRYLDSGDTAALRKHAVSHNLAVFSPYAAEILVTLEDAQALQEV